MNLAVKELSGIDPPVSTMQLIWIRMVCSIRNLGLWPGSERNFFRFTDHHLAMFGVLPVFC